MFYLRFSGHSVDSVLEQMKTSARGYQKFVSAYPAVSCAPLDKFYLYRKATGMLDEELLCDLLFSYTYGWREANWAAWLAALAPQPAYAAHLARRLPTLSNGSTLMQLALAACGQAMPQELRKNYATLEEVRETLNRLPACPAPLRRSPTPDHERAFKRERIVIRDAFRTGGLDAAKPMLSQGCVGYYTMSHAEWLAAGAPDAPAVPRMRRLRHHVLPRF